MQKNVRLTLQADFILHCQANEKVFEARVVLGKEGNAEGHGGLVEANDVLFGIRQVHIAAIVGPVYVPTVGEWAVAGFGTAAQETYSNWVDLLSNRIVGIAQSLRLALHHHRGRLGLEEHQLKGAPRWLQGNKVLGVKN